MKTTSRILVCVLGAIFIFSSLGAVYAVDPEPSPTPTVPPVPQNERSNLQLEMASYYVYLVLQSWGIDIQYRNISEFTDDVKDWLIDIMFDYCEDIGVTIAQWIFPWIANFDFWGNLSLNDRALEDIQDFSVWLKDKFNLQDNTQIIVNPTYSVNGAYLYQIDTNYRLQYMDGTDSGEYFAMKFGSLSGHDYDTTVLGYIIINITSDNINYSPQVRFITYNPGEYHYSIIVYDWNSDVANSGGGVKYVNLGPSTHSVYYSDGSAFDYGSGNTWGYGTSNPMQLTGNNPIVEYSSLNTYLQGLEVVQNGDFKFVVSDINLPYEDPNYTNGDSITIIGDKPEYSVIEWSGEVTVSNLPAIVSTGTIPVPGDELNPGLVNAWHPISTLIEMTADSMGMLIGIVYEFPEEVLIPIFAVLGGIIIFGIIHAMKEH